MQAKRAVVTGGAGFVGSALVRMLARNGWQTLVYDALNPGRADFLPADEAGIELVVGDILDTERLTKTLQTFQPDVVFHLAAIHYIPYCNAHPLETLRVNVEGTESVLRAVRATSIPRLLFTSTAAVYPAQAGTLHEHTPASPLDIYGFSKQFGEQLVHWHQQQTHTTCAIARLFNVYGPRETSRHLIPELLDQIVDGATEIKMGNLDPKRDYVYVDDVARALFGLATLPGERPEAPLVVNVGTGIERSAREVLEELQVVVGRNVTIVQDPARVRASDRPHLCADVSTLRSLLGWVPDNDFHAGLERLLAWTLRSRELGVPV